MKVLQSNLKISLIQCNSGKKRNPCCSSGQAYLQSFSIKEEWLPGMCNHELPSLCESILTHSFLLKLHKETTVIPVWTEKKNQCRRNSGFFSQLQSSWLAFLVQHSSCRWPEDWPLRISCGEGYRKVYSSCENTRHTRVRFCRSRTCWVTVLPCV